MKLSLLKLLLPPMKLLTNHTYFLFLIMCPLLPFDEEADDGIRHKLSELSLVPKSIEFRLSLLLDFFILVFSSLAFILLLLMLFTFFPPPLVVLIKRGIRALVGLEIKGSSVVSNELVSGL